MLPEITMTPDPALTKWDQPFTANVHVTGAGEGDTISIDWGDGTTPTEISPVPSSGDATATHVYDKSVANTQKTITAKLVNGETERATTQVLITIQKHATSLTLDMRPSPEKTVCTNCPFTTFGKLVDLDSVSEPVPDVSLATASASSTSSTFSSSSTSSTSDPEEIPGKTISFSGTGVSTLPHSVPTEGLTFTDSNDLTLISGALRMHVGASADLSYSGVSASGVTLSFQGASGSSVRVTLTKVGGGPPVIMDVPVGSTQNAQFAKGFSKLTITSVDGNTNPSAYGDLATIITRNVQVSPQEQFEIHFNNVVPTPDCSEGCPVLVIHPGSYFAAGTTQLANANGLKIKAQFDGTSDPAYSSAVPSPEISYSVDSSVAGSGDSDTTPDDTTIWTTLTVGTATVAPLTEMSVRLMANEDSTLIRMVFVTGGKIQTTVLLETLRQHIGMWYVLQQDLTSQVP